MRGGEFINQGSTLLKLYYKVASSHLPAISSSPDTPRTKVVLPSHQFSSSSSPDTPRTKVVLQSRQFSSSKSCTSKSPVLISRTRHARSPQRIARVPDTSHSGLHFAHSTRAISAEGCADRTNALSPAFRARDTHDFRRGLRAHRTNRTLARISRIPHARSPQRVARTWDKSHSRLHFVHSTRPVGKLQR